VPLISFHFQSNEGVGAVTFIVVRIDCFFVNFNKKMIFVSCFCLPVFPFVVLDLGNLFSSCTEQQPKLSFFPR
jgi:hypothetical protein